MTTKKNPGFNALIALKCLIVISIVSCNNPEDTGQDSTTEAGKSDQTAQQPQQNAGAFLGDGKFAHLAIHKDSLENFFFTNPPTGYHSKKMVFRFAHDGDNTSPIIIDGFLARNNSINFLDRPAVSLVSCGNGKSDLSGQKVYLSDLELSRAQYLKLRNSAGNNTYLAFYPHAVGSTPPSQVQYCVTYRMMWIADCQTFAPPQIQITAYDPDSDLNPCPPNQPGQ